MYIRATRALAEYLTAYKQDINKFNIYDFTIWDNMQNINHIEIFKSITNNKDYIHIV